jgi:murein L,D-transpeptidase YafK
MMKKAWLIVADTFVIILLFLSLTLFYLYPPVYKPPQPPAFPALHTVSEKDLSCRSTGGKVDENVTVTVRETLYAAQKHDTEVLTLEEIMRMSREIAMKEYLEEKQYLYVNLKKRLRVLHAQEGDPVYIRIFKKEAVLEIWIKTGATYEHLKDYAVCAYSGHLGPKLKEGDRQAPEGFYRVYPSQLNPHSRFHLAFNLGYPNAYDRAHHRTGSYLMVHGNCRSIGCYAMTDEKIEEIYGLVDAALQNGQPYVPVHIFPFKMEDTLMDSYSESRWYEFWMALKEGYDYFEAEEVPPSVEVKNGEYVILESDEGAGAL